MNDGHRDNVSTIAGLTTEIVAVYVSHHGVATADFGRLVTTVAQELGGLGHELEPPTGPEPAVPVRQSVKRDHLVCLVCGKSFKSLRRHLRTSHELTPPAYREQFGLGRDYPMVAAACAEQRAAIARRSNLGRHGPPEQAPEASAMVEPEVPSEPQPTQSRKVKTLPRVAPTAAAPQPGLKPVRGRRAPKRAAVTSAATDRASQSQSGLEPEPRRKRRARESDAKGG